MVGMGGGGVSLHLVGIHNGQELGSQAGSAHEEAIDVGLKH